MLARSPSSETLNALQVLIEQGGLERELTIQLRRKYLDLTERQTAERKEA